MLKENDLRRLDQIKAFCCVLEILVVKVGAVFVVELLIQCNIVIA